MASDLNRSNPKANFFLVGAPKAGTTSVDRLLRQHPEVMLSPIKEPCHFCADVNAQLVRGQGHEKCRMDLSSYLASREREVVHLRQVSSPEDYQRLFDGAHGRKIVGECSTYYLSSTVAAERIHSYNPDAKILVLIRNPLDRIRSHYVMDRSLGLASRPLVELVEEELALGDDAHWGNCRYYVGASRYTQQLERYRRLFAPGNICVLAFEKLIAEPDVELRRMFHFLDIAPPADPLKLPLENKSRPVRFPRLHDSLRKSGLKPAIAGVLKNTMSMKLGQAARSIYYREKLQLVPEQDLGRIRELLRQEGLDPLTALAA
jgi:hypothetical protein